MNIQANDSIVMKSKRSENDSKQATVEIKVERTPSRMQNNATVTLNDKQSPAGNVTPSQVSQDAVVTEEGKQAKKTPEVSPIKIPLDPTSRHLSGITSEVTDIQIDNNKTSKVVSVNQHSVYENQDHNSTLGKTMSPNADSSQRAVIITRSINNPVPSNVKVSTQGSVG